MGCVSSKKKLSKADLEFLQDNTEFTKEQIVEWYEGFIVSISKQLDGSRHREIIANSICVRSLILVMLEK